MSFTLWIILSNLLLKFFHVLCICCFLVGCNGWFSVDKSGGFLSNSWISFIPGSTSAHSSGKSFLNFEYHCETRGNGSNPKPIASRQRVADTSPKSAIVTWSVNERGHGNENSVIFSLIKLNKYLTEINLVFLQYPTTFWVISSRWKNSLNFILLDVLLLQDSCPFILNLLLHSLTLAESTAFCIWYGKKTTKY